MAEWAWTVVIMGAIGLVLTMMLWPTPSTGKRLLKKWQVPDPTEAQVTDAVRYLRKRRLLYPWIYVAGAFGPEFDSDMTRLVIIVLGGALLAELIALRPPRSAQRVASLVPRGLTDIAAKGVLISYIVIVLGVLVHLCLQQEWQRVLWLGVSVAAVAVITWAAVARPATGDQQVDMALRTRSVHVSAGLGAAVAAVLIPGKWGFIGILAWIAMAHTKPLPTKINR
ncbi:hypothetical protein [Lentzea flava]|uniref:Uncharacterized protein n=1 Tax=Lentzea flava TaxID=103732 RepID=A0ABQ2UC00_9PSEU|nr:hypothetical protein [Lentzea flava]MCP2197473.1 hypothetical protein [Lentzea flava]GGU19922.1 hypothetical protein GCM10010178_09980 [Lentzea flava]